jgi:putative transposase
MIEPAHDLAITKQAKALNISRGSVYYLPRPVPETDLAIMRRLDRLHLELPFAGSRMLRGLLAAEGCKIGRRHVKTLMKRMGIEALYRRPRTTKPERPQDVPVSAARDGDCPAEPGVGDGHHLHPDGTRLCLSGRCARLVQPSRAVVGRIDHHGGGVLRRDAGGCFGSSRQAGHLQ